MPKGVKAFPKGELRVELFNRLKARLAAANAISSIILKWKGQFACALVWWTAAGLSCFGTVTQSSIIGLVAIFLGQIVFGSYMMISEARDKKGSERTSGAAHA